MVEVWVLALAVGDAQLEVAQLGRLAIEDDIVGDARLVRVGLVDLQAAQALERVVPDNGRGQVGRGILTRNALDPHGPAAAMLAAGELDELGGHVDAIGGVVDRLAAAAAHVVFVPAVAIELVLLARVPESCIGSVSAVAVVLGVGAAIAGAAVAAAAAAVLTVLHILIVLDPCPQQPARQTLRDARPHAKVQVRFIRTPEQAVVACLFDLSDLRVGARPLRLQRQQTCQAQACPAAAMWGVGCHGLYHLPSRIEEWSLAGSKRIRSI